MDGMDGDQIANLIYLVLLGSALLLWYVAQNRGGLGKMVQHLLAWGLIFLAVIAAYGLWPQISNTVMPRQAIFANEGRIELPRNADGHYYVTLDVNSAPVRFVVDTGASAVVLTRDDAERAGLKSTDLSFFSEAMTANGPVKTAPVSLDRVELGPFLDNNVGAYVNSGEMDASLLGMNYLSLFDRIEISGGKLVLQR